MRFMNFYEVLILKTVDNILLKQLQSSSLKIMKYCTQSI